MSEPGLRLTSVDAVTIRRLIVFGVCALGVAGLYLVPSVSGSTGLVATPRIADEQTPRTSSTSAVRAPQTAGSGAGRPAQVRDAVGEPTQAAADEPQVDAQDEDDRARPSSRPSATGRTAYDPKDAPDSEPPATVTTIAPAKVTVDELSLSWPPATDNRRVIGYRIWLNGYEVATTAQTKATVSWFNGDEGQHVVQIKAIDAAGNQSPAWSTLLVTRPAPEPTATPRPSATPTPTSEPAPDPEPEPTTEPEPEPTESASVAPRPEPTTSNQASVAPTRPAPTTTGAG